MRAKAIVFIVRQLILLIRLSHTQREILGLIEQNSSLTATSFVSTLSIPSSTAWHNLRELKKKKLIVFGSNNPIRLTDAGRVFLNNPNCAGACSERPCEITRFNKNITVMNLKARLRNEIKV